MRRQVWKKGVAALLAGSLAVIAAGCGKPAEEAVKTSGGNFTFGEDELSFTWYDNSDTAAATIWADTSIPEKWIKENKKVDIKYMDPGGASAEKLATMIVSDSFPDVMTMLRGQDTAKLIASGKIVPINEYMEKYTVMRDDLGKSGIFKMFEQPDGKIYEIPNWANAAGKPNGNNGWVVNTKFYNELGRPEIKTLDDFYSYLKAVKEKYPDVIPYETTDVFQGERYVLAAMAEDMPPDMLNYFAYTDNGSMHSIFKHPAYRETMLFLNKLFREKLMTQDAFSQTADQVKEKFSNCKVAVTTSAIGACEDTRVELQKLGGDWETITPPMKEGLDRAKTYSQGYDRMGWTELLISKDAKNPEGIYAYLDWLYSPEGQRLYCYGPAGMFYDEVTPEGYPIMKENYFAAADPGKELKGNGGSMGIGNTSYVDGAGIYIDENAPEDKKSWGKQQQLNNIWPYAKDISEFSGIIPGAATDEGIIYQTVTDLHKQARAKILFAADDQEVNQLLDKLIEDTDKAGMDKLLAAEEKIWKENREKLGLNS